MNTLVLPGTIWLAADVHLGEHGPQTARAFSRFLQAASGQADALILCGDLFDAWIGDDDALRYPPAWLQAAVQALRQAAAAVPLYLMHGNRDFLMGPALASYLGAHLLAAPLRLQTDAGPLLLAHGDEYCVDDVGYQRFRRIVRQAWVQRLFLKLPLAWRRAAARQARQRSQRAQRAKTMQIMDVNPRAVSAALRIAGCTTLVHGHTHRPAVHRFELDGQPAQRHVLPDWMHEPPGPSRGGWITIDGGGLTLHASTGLEGA
ncbi:UDP-2,3-diacylglucosamine diphosphatase [Castellaniella sp.]|uniref:UDP-2,3-diacylglucosamine diphosphatase n=1 Tax=Castellaniella sp. TaxID=1955812 RepID=UPI0035601AF9